MTLNNSCSLCVTQFVSCFVNLLGKRHEILIYFKGGPHMLSSIDESLEVQMSGQSLNKLEVQHK